MNTFHQFPLNVFSQRVSIFFFITYGRAKQDQTLGVVAVHTSKACVNISNSLAEDQLNIIILWQLTCVRMYGNSVIGVSSVRYSTLAISGNLRGRSTHPHDMCRLFKNASFARLHSAHITHIRTNKHTHTYILNVIFVVDLYHLTITRPERGGHSRKMIENYVQLPRYSASNNTTLAEGVFSSTQATYIYCTHTYEISFPLTFHHNTNLVGEKQIA